MGTEISRWKGYGVAAVAVAGALVALAALIGCRLGRDVAAPAGPGSFGITWTELPGNPALTAGTSLSWHFAGVGDPTVVRRPDGSLAIWFTTMGIRWTASGFAADGPWVGRAIGDPLRGGMKISPDAPVVPVGPDGSWDRYVETPTVRKREDGKLTMWYMGYAARGGTTGFVAPAIGQMTAGDAQGTAWRRPERPIYRPDPKGWDGVLATGPTVVRGPDGQWRLYYSAYGTRQGIGLLVSADGVNWKQGAGGPVLPNRPGEWDAEILEQASVYVRGKFWMWYSAFQGPLKPSTPISIGLATSSDGIHWKRYAGNPVLRPGPAGSWDDLSVLAPDVIVEKDGSLLMAAYGHSTKDASAAQSSVGLWRSGP